MVSLLPTYPDGLFIIGSVAVVECIVLFSVDFHFGCSTLAATLARWMLGAGHLQAVGCDPK
jgi:hypothetical protein